MTTETEARYYGVSSGNGNDGVSQMFPDYIVKTNQPYRLAELAALSTFNKPKGVEWARENIEIEGESDYTIYVLFYESPETQDERAEVESRLDAMRDAEDSDESEIEELESELEGFNDCGYTWLIFEVFPWDSEYKSPDETGRPVFESLEDAFGEDTALSTETE